VNALWLATAGLVALWLLGMSLRLFGDLIHLLLLAAVLLSMVSLLTGRRTSR